MPESKSYNNTIQVIESLQDCIVDHKMLIKHGMDKAGFNEQNNDHYALSGILSRSLNKKLFYLINDKQEGKIDEAEYRRHLVKFKMLLTADIMTLAPELEVEKMKTELNKIEQPQQTANKLISDYVQVQTKL